MLTIKETGFELSCSRSTVLRMIAAGKLSTTTVGVRGVRVHAADVDALLG